MQSWTLILRLPFLTPTFRTEDAASSLMEATVPMWRVQHWWRSLVWIQRSILDLTSFNGWQTMEKWKWPNRWWCLFPLDAIKMNFFVMLSHGTQSPYSSKDMEIWSPKSPTKDSQTGIHSFLRVRRFPWFLYLHGKLNKISSTWERRI